MRIRRAPGMCPCGKLSYETKSDARVARKYYRQKRHWAQFVYHAAECDTWHLTSQRPRHYSPRMPAPPPRLLSRA